jgi:hypothetical protein
MREEGPSGVQERSRRGRWQFSFGALMVFVTVVSVGLALAVVEPVLAVVWAAIILVGRGAAWAAAGNPGGSLSGIAAGCLLLLILMAFLALVAWAVVRAFDLGPTF